MPEVRQQLFLTDMAQAGYKAEACHTTKIQT